MKSSFRIVCLLMIAVALDSVRRQNRSPINAVSSLDELDVLEDKSSVADAVGFQEKIEILTDVIAALPARRRELILLCKFSDLPPRKRPHDSAFPTALAGVPTEAQ